MAQQEMIFSDYLRVIAKRKWTVLTLTLLVVAATYVQVSHKEPVFTSTARIKVERLQTFTGVFDQMFVSGGDPLENYIHEIRGDTVLQAAAAMLAIGGDNVAPSALSRMITVARLKGTDLIDITVTGPGAEGARRRCDAVVRAFAQVRDEMITSSDREEYDYIRKSLMNATNSVAKLDAEIRSKLEAVGTTDLAGEQTKILRARLLDTHIKLQALRDQGNFTEEYPEIVSLKSAAGLLEARVLEESEKDTKVQTILREYDQKKKIMEEMVSFLTKREEDARIAQTKKRERIEQIEHASPGVPVTTGTAYLTAIGLMLGLMLGIIFAFVAENLDASIRTLVEIEETFHLPILGVIPHFSPHDPDVPIRRDRFWDKVEYAITMNSAAIVWRAAWAAIARRAGKNRRSPAKSAMLVVVFSPRAPATEGYRAIRTHLQLAAHDEKIGAVLVTSSGPAEGKSTTISNLAFAFAQAGRKTLLVCANMRRPTLHRTFGVPRERGLSEVLVGELTWREVLRDHRDLAIGERSGEGLATAVGAENLFFITSGGRTIQPAEWLSLPIFKETVKEWESEFDVVLIDGPPVLPVPDSVIIASCVHHVVLVYQAGVTHRNSMFRTISLIEKTGVAISGLVLNDLRASGSDSPDHFHYRGYYGRREKEA